MKLIDAKFSDEKILPKYKKKLEAKKIILQEIRPNDINELDGYKIPKVEKHTDPEIVIDKKFTRKHKNSLSEVRFSLPNIGSSSSALKPISRIDSHSTLSVKPKDLFGSKLSENPYENSFEANSTKNFRSLRMDKHLHGVKNKNLRLSLEVKQLGKDIVDNVLCFHKSNAHPQKSQKKIKSFGESVFTKDELEEEYERREQREDQIIEAFETMNSKVENNYTNKCWNSVNMSLKAETMQDIVRRRRIRRFQKLDGARSMSTL